MPSALITGAASGIGRCFSEVLAAKGYDLFLLDIDGAGLAETLKNVTVHTARARVCPCDVSARESVERSFAELLPVGQGLDLLINCAAILGGGPWADQPAETFEKVLDVNLLGTVNVIRAARPALSLAGGQAVILASTAALHGWPQLVAYSASKFAVAGFAEAIRGELAKGGIGLTVAFPLLIDTPLLHGPGTPPILRKGRPIPARRVVDRVLDAAARRRDRVYIPRTVRVIAALQGVAPSLLDWFGRRFGED